MTSTSVMNDRPNWARDSRSWPNSAASRFVDAAGLHWHIQEMGCSGPKMLLVHGTGSATHSWGGLLPLLAERYQVLAMDLPGHGFTSAPAPKRLSLPGMASALAELLRLLDFAPSICVGHSAGAAILARACLDDAIHPRLLISLSGALLPLRGFAGRWFRPAANLFARNSLVPRFFARGARKDPLSVQRMVDGTGSRLSPEGVALYRLLVSYPGHVAAALNMMSNWDLEPLLADLPRLEPELVLVSFADDRTIPPAEAERAKVALPGAHRRHVARYGHLAHEEAPRQVFELIRELDINAGSAAEA